MTDALEVFTLVRFNRKSGKIDTVLEAYGNAMLRMWALQHTTKTKDTMIFSKASGELVVYIQGTSDFPKLMDKNLGNVEDYCPGLLDALHKQDSDLK
jgi:hypothetical protein